MGFSSLKRCYFVLGRMDSYSPPRRDKLPELCENGVLEITTGKVNSFHHPNLLAVTTVPQRSQVTAMTVSDVVRLIWAARFDRARLSAPVSQICAAASTVYTSEMLTTAENLGNALRLRTVNI
jgi:hypothetical protein